MRTCATAEIVSFSIEFAFATNTGTAVGAVGGRALAARTAMSFGEVCATKYSPPAPTAVSIIASAVANSGASAGKTATSVQPSTKAAGKSGVTNLPNLSGLPLSLAAPAPETPVQVRLPSLDQISPPIPSAPEPDATTAQASLPTHAGLAGVQVSGRVAQPSATAQFTTTSANTRQVAQVSSSPEVPGQGKVAVEAVPDSSSSRPSSTDPSSSTNSGSTSPSSTIASSSNAGSADPVWFDPFLQSSAPQVPATTDSDSQATALFVNDPASGTQDGSTVSQPLETTVRTLVAPEATIAASTSAQLQSPAKPVAISSTGGYSSAASTSANPNLMRVPETTPVPTQDGAVTGGQVSENSPPPVLLFAAAANSAQKNASVSAVVAVTNRAATPQEAQTTSQKTLTGIAMPSPTATDLAASLHSAVARSIVEFSDEKVVAPLVVTPPHSSTGTNLQSSFTSPPASPAGNKPSADTAATSPKSPVSAPVPSGPASRNASAQNTHANNDAEPGSSGNHSPDAQHKETAATEPVVSTVQAPAALQIPLIAVSEVAPDAASAPAAPPSPPQSSGGSSNPADLPANLPSANLPATATATPVQIAQMVNSAAQSEMRIGMNTANFGGVEVRAVVHASEVGVVIGSEKGDLRSALATEIPGIANSLEQQNLRLSPVSFQQHGFAFSSDLSSGGQAQPRSFSSKPNFSTGLQPESASAEPDPQPERSRSTSSSGLSILA